MNKHLFNTVLALLIPSISNFFTISTLAQGKPPVPSIQNQEVTIPQSSAVTVTFSAAVTFNADQKDSLPIAALLTQPLLDSSGKVAAPANSLVSMKLQPAEGGAKIKAEALIIGGQLIPIQASGPWIPGQTVERVSSSQQAQLNQTLFSGLGGSVLGIVGAATGGDRDEITSLTTVGNFVGAGLGIVLGLFSPKKSRQVLIPSGTMHILVLQAPVLIPSKVIQPPLPAAPARPTPPPAATPAARPTLPAVTPAPAARPTPPVTTPAPAARPTLPPTLPVTTPAPAARPTPTRPAATPAPATTPNPAPATPAAKSTPSSSVTLSPKLRQLLKI